MPYSSNSKKISAEAGSSKKSVSNEVTPLRISSRVRKEKFNVKELFSTAKDKDSSDDEPQKHVPKKKGNAQTPLSVSKAQLDKESKMHVVRVDVTKSKIGSSAKSLETPLSKAGSSKTPQIAKSTTSAVKKQESSITSTSKDDKTSKVTSPKAKISKTGSKEETSFDPLVVDSIKIEPIFNEDNIDTVLENPSSLGLDIVVTKLSESDQRDQTESRKSKNIVTIAKVTGSSSASKPIKVVPMKPTDKLLDTSEKSLDKTIEFKTSGGVVITPKAEKTVSKNLVADKKSKMVHVPRPSSAARAMSSSKIADSNLIESKIKSSSSTEVFVVTQTIDNKGTISTRTIEKKRELIEPKSHKSKLAFLGADLDKIRRPDLTSDKYRDGKMKSMKRSLLDIKTNGVSGKSNKITAVEADSSSHELEMKKAKVVEEIFGEIDSDPQEVDLKKPTYDFNRYFDTAESIIEHNESLDSDASDEDSQTYLSHFYEKESLNKNKTVRVADSSIQDSSESFTIYDLMYEVNCQFPAWNLHVMQDTSSFLICHVTRGANGLPTMSKMIELEEDFRSAKVYINQIFHREFCGSYNTYDSIRELITNVQNL